MSLRINDFSSKSGYVIEERGDNKTMVVLPIYGEDKCNCFLSCLYESAPDENGVREYNLRWFMNDESHAKRFLGLIKNYNGERDNCIPEVTKLILFKKNCSNWKKIMTLFASAFSDIAIEIHEEELDD